MGRQRDIYGESELTVEEVACAQAWLRLNPEGGRLASFRVYARCELGQVGAVGSKWVGRVIRAAGGVVVG